MASAAAFVETKGAFPSVSDRQSLDSHINLLLVHSLREMSNYRRGFDDVEEIDIDDVPNTSNRQNDNEVRRAGQNFHQRHPAPAPRNNLRPTSNSTATAGSNRAATIRR